MTRGELYYLGSRLLPYLPPRFAYPLCSLIGVLGPRMPVWPRIMQNLRYAFPEASPATHRRYGRMVMGGLLKNYYDLLRAHAISSLELARSTDVQGLDNLLGALARGKGVVVAMPHIGNLSLVAEPVATLARTRIVVVVERMRDPAIHTILNTLRRRPNVEVVEIGPLVVRKLLRVLQAGEIVVLPGDRTVAAATVAVSFFGGRALVPAGPAALALRTGAPLLTSYTYRRPSNASVVVVDPPLAVERRQSREETTQRLMQAVIHVFEAYIRGHPGQWLVTEPVWSAA